MDQTMCGESTPIVQSDLFGSDWIVPPESQPNTPRRTLTKIQAVVEGETKVGLSQLTLELLESPLVEPEAEIIKRFGFDVSGNMPVMEPEEEKPVVYFGDNGTANWSDNDHDILHEALICWHLGQLASRNNVEGKLEALEWIYQPDVFLKKTVRLKNGQMIEKRIYAKQVPFTFQQACLRAGYDCERIQLGLEHVLRKAGLHELVKHIAGA